MESITRVFNNVDWVTTIFVVSLFVMVLSKTFFYNKFINFVALPFNNKYIFLHSKKHILFNWFNVLWSVFLWLNAALFIYYLLSIFKFKDTLTPINYLFIFGILSLFVVVKLVLQFINSFIFNAETAIVHIVFNKISYQNYSGLVLFAANIFLTYITPYSELVAYLAVVLFVVVMCIGWVNLLRIHRNFITINFFYFILYLCALEISPFVIIGSYLKY
ncbi:DUF4271 domain-containing protein [Cellulophaga omnivescoria]|uniref:DUF4271 domain-containing protein n=1 Tax=Cellulophaga omnivescoria TaxID=1888890 RepID=UPI000984347C|nr:DUF4271 domain-containing protein [Cellulophaga omnivescoria]WBU90344.1 DUF4271 domain-containing protein [Cellulophaga omnivescoria]